MERGWKPNVELAPTCPRCGSSNTKFCYYNNYCLTQPRYFCKGCRRYWTKGGSLRNVPVGGGCRKSRRSKPLHISSSRGFASLSHINGNHLATESSTSMSATPQAPNIDLAMVYSNFLNQKPEIEDHDDHDHLEVSQLMHNNVGPSFDFNSVHNMMNMTLNGGPECAAFVDSLILDQNHPLQQENPTSTTWLSPIDEHQFASTAGTSNYGLPPLPGEELGVSEHMVWPPLQTDVMLHRHHQMLHVSDHSSGLEGEGLNIVPNQVNDNNETSLSNIYDFSGLGK